MQSEFVRLRISSTITTSPVNVLLEGTLRVFSSAKTSWLEPEIPDIVPAEIHVCRSWVFTDRTCVDVVNGGWDAVGISTLDVYPEGAAARANRVPTVPFTPTPDFASIAASCGCYAETVELAEELPAVLELAVQVIREDRWQVLLDVRIGMDDGEK